MMVEIIPKKIKKASEWHNIGIYAAGCLLIAVVLGYAALFYFEAKILDAAQNLEDKIAQVGVKEEKNTEAKVLLAQKRINAFAELLQAHKKSSNFFTLLEEASHPQVWFNEVELNVGKAEALVSGKTSNFQTLGQQLLILEQQNGIAKAELTDLFIGKKGETEFSFYLYLDPQLFYLNE